MEAVIQLTEKQAIEFYDSGVWKDMNYISRARFQMLQDRICMPFSVFHEAVEKAVGRPVWTHEFGLNRDGLMKELFEGAPPPSMQEIINMIPEDKRIIFSLGN
jgi:hypothetical protein